MLDGTSLLYGIYTISPLHVGTGQAAGAVDLPIAREQSTGLPFVPASAIKGVIRDVLEIHTPLNSNADSLIEDYLGPDMEGQKGLKAGGLIFTEAQVLALPFRSLNHPFVFATSRLVLERFHRNLRSFGVREKFFLENIDRFSDDRVYVADAALENQVLVVEDMIFSQAEVKFSQTAQDVAKGLSTLLPEAEASTRERIEKSLVILPDLEYTALAKRCLPVQARIRLSENKTTTDDGNLWYEETVPSDSLFAFFILNRPGACRTADLTGQFAEDLTRHKVDLSLIQMGGNETVGHGWTLWHRPGHLSTGPGNTGKE